jgi:hypothetical protein
MNAILAPARGNALADLKRGTYVHWWPGLVAKVRLWPRRWPPDRQARTVRGPVDIAQWINDAA